MKCVVHPWAVPALVLALVVPAAAQQAAAPASSDPRVGLKAGVRDAGVAAKGFELLANLPKPEGFFDPKFPAGEPNPRMPAGDEEKEASEAAKTPAPKPAAAANAKRPQRSWGGLNFANSDLAFSGNHLFVGNFSGFNIYDVTTPTRPALLTSVVCPGGQGDVSVHGTLLFMSVEQTRGRLDCGVGGVENPVSKDRFRGVRIFDISDIRAPKQVAAVQTCRGSHTHTLVTDPKDPANVYVYGSGTSTDCVSSMGKRSGTKSPRFQVNPIALTELAWATRWMPSWAAASNTLKVPIELISNVVELSAKRGDGSAARWTTASHDRRASHTSSYRRTSHTRYSMAVVCDDSCRSAPRTS